MILHSSVTHMPCKRWHAISLLLANDYGLLDYIFTPDRTALAAPANELLGASTEMSSGQRLLIKIALDIWSDEGNANLGEILTILDPYRFESFMLALEFYRYSH